ncbi:MAG: hypothetical protein PVH41_13180 [Anaerolineae bacterium]
MSVSGKPQADLMGYRNAVTFCLAVLLLSTTTLALAGPIGDPEFTDISSPASSSFTPFLLALWLTGLASAYSVAKGWSGAYWAAIIVGWAYVTVAAVGLCQVILASPNPTGFAVGTVMIADAILALNIVVRSHKALGHT